MSIVFIIFVVYLVSAAVIAIFIIGSRPSLETLNEMIARRTDFETRRLHAKRSREIKRQMQQIEEASGRAETKRRARQNTLRHQWHEDAELDMTLYSAAFGQEDKKP